MSKRFIVRVLLATCLALLTVFSLAPGVFAQTSSNDRPLSEKNTPSWLPWHIVASSNAGPQNELTAIAALSGKDAWAVGDYHAPAPSLSKTLTEHWNGSTWKVVSSPNVGVADHQYGVAMAASNDVWAVGNSLNSHDVGFTLILHWNGAHWRVVKSPSAGAPSGTTLYAVTAIASNDVWAVGQVSQQGIFQTLTEHWNGTSWSILPSPNVPNRFNFLLGVTALGSKNVWAVGYSYNESTPDRTLILHWNGKRWRIVKSPNASADWNALYAVTAAPGGPATAVGYYFDTGNTTKTLIEASR